MIVDDIKALKTWAVQTDWNFKAQNNAHNQWLRPLKRFITNTTYNAQMYCKIVLRCRKKLSVDYTITDWFHTQEATWEVTNCLADQVTPHLARGHKAYWKETDTGPYLQNMNPVHNLTSNLFMIHFNNILPLHLDLQRSHFSFDFLTEYSMHLPYLPCMLYTPPVYYHATSPASCWGLLLRLSYGHIFFSACSRTPSAHLLLLHHQMSLDINSLA
jgi:hypothetical protein